MAVLAAIMEVEKDDSTATVHQGDHSVVPVTTTKGHNNEQHL